MVYEHVITNAQTGEVTVVPFTPQETTEWEAKAAEQVATQADPVEKLKQFLAANPDVAAILN